MDNKTNSEYDFTLLPVYYSNEYPIIKPTINFEQNQNNNLERILTKAKLWNYEKEIRYILTGGTSKAIKIDTTIYKEIIFGSNMNPKTKEQINSSLNEFYPHIKRF